MLSTTYALPPPMMKTSAWRSLPQSSCLVGDRSKSSFSGCTSRFSSVVLRTQIFHSVMLLLLLLLTGKSITFPPQVAAGEPVRKTIPQSMKFCVHKSLSAIVYTIPALEQLLTRVGVAGINWASPSTAISPVTSLEVFVFKRLVAITPGVENVRKW